MTVTLAQLRARQQVLADMVGSLVLTDLEWDDLTRDGIRALWADVTSVNKDFRVNVLAFTLTSTNVQALPSDFREVRAVRRNPGTQTQEILNKLGERSGSLDCNRSYRLQGSFLYIEPLVQAAGTYDLKYVPTPPVLPSPDFTVVAASSGGDIVASHYAATGGPGVGKTLTSNLLGEVLTVSGKTLFVGDRFLLKDSFNTSLNGIYTVTQIAAAGVPWIAVRATDFDQDQEIAVGKVVLVTDSAVANSAWQVSTFTSIDAGALLFTSATTFTTTLDAEIEQHQDCIVLHAVIEAMGKTESDSSTFFRLLNGVPGTDEIGARGRLKRWASDQRSADPDGVEDVRRRRRWVP